MFCQRPHFVTFFATFPAQPSTWLAGGTSKPKLAPTINGKKGKHKIWRIFMKHYETLKLNILWYRLVLPTTTTTKAGKTKNLNKSGESRRWCVWVCEEVVIWENYNVALHAWLPYHKLPLSENQTKSAHLREKSLNQSQHTGNLNLRTFARGKKCTVFNLNI